MTSTSTEDALARALRVKHLCPSTAWLANLLATQRPGLPLPALVSTATFRLLATDLTSRSAFQVEPDQSSYTDRASGDEVHASLPQGLLAKNVQEPQRPEQTLHGAIVVQVIDLLDVGRSAWEQLEDLERRERGEMVRGREIVRLDLAEATAEFNPEAQSLEIPGHSGVGAAAATASTRSGAGTLRKEGPYKVLVQDAAGTAVWGFEQSSVPGLGKVAMGCKLLLRDVIVARGLVLLDETHVSILGGRVEELHRTWIGGKKERLRALAQGSAHDPSAINT